MGVYQMNKIFITLSMGFAILLGGCEEGTSAKKMSYSIKQACEKIKLVSEDAKVCPCVASKVGDSKEAVAVMNWLENDKKSDPEGYPLAGWLMISVSKDPKREGEFTNLLEGLGEEKGGKKNQMTHGKQIPC